MKTFEDTLYSPEESREVIQDFLRFSHRLTTFQRLDGSMHPVLKFLVEQIRLSLGNSIPDQGLLQEFETLIKTAFATKQNVQRVVGREAVA